VPRQIEVAVVCQVADGVRIGDSLIVDGKGVAFQCVGDIDLHVAGVGFLSVSTFKAELYEILTGILNSPDLVRESHYAAVQMIGAVVDGKGVLFSIEAELTLGYAVCISAYHCAQIGIQSFIFPDAVVTQYDVNRLTLAVRHCQRLDSCAEAQNFAGDIALGKDTYSKGGIVSAGNNPPLLSNRIRHQGRCVV